MFIEKSLRPHSEPLNRRVISCKARWPHAFLRAAATVSGLKTARGKTRVREIPVKDNRNLRLQAPSLID